MKISTIHVIWLVCFALLAMTGVRAQPVTKSLDDCIRQALDNNLQLKLERIAVEKAKTLQATAFDIGKTGFSMSQDPTSGGSPDNSLSVSQSFDFPSVYIARKKVLQAETDVEQRRMELSAGELVKEVTALYYSLLHARETVRILQKQDSIYSRFVFLASAKFRSGETSRLEQIHAEKLYNENQIEIRKAEKDFQTIRLLLQQALNTNEWIEPQEDTLPVIVQPSLPVPVDVSQLPSAKVYESLLKAGEKNLSLQRQGFLPEFTVSLRNQFLLKGFNPYSIDRERFAAGNFMGFEVGVSLPLFFGQQRAKAQAAKKEVERLRTQQETALLSLHTERETKRNDYLQAKTALEYYLHTGKRQAEEIARISQLSYEKGEIGYIEYIQNLRTVVEMQLQQANAVNEYNQAVIQLRIMNYEL